MNKFIGIGNLVANPELRTVGGDKSVCNFKVAIQRAYKNQSGEYDADFFPVVVWGKLAENCQKYLSMGKKVAVEGSMESRSYDAKDGTKRYITEIKAKNVEFLSPVNSNQTAQSSATPAPQEISEDMPF